MIGIGFSRRVLAGAAVLIVIRMVLVQHRKRAQARVWTAARDAR